jgi:hypothetical protein
VSDTLRDPATSLDHSAESRGPRAAEILDAAVNSAQDWELRRNSPTLPHLILTNLETPSYTAPGLIGDRGGVSLGRICGDLLEGDQTTARRQALRPRSPGVAAPGQRMQEFRTTEYGQAAALEHLALQSQIPDGPAHRHPRDPEPL